MRPSLRRHKGLVRLYLRPPEDITLEGLYGGHRRGHYTLYSPRQLTDNHTDPAELTGYITVPDARVLYLQHIG